MVLLRPPHFFHVFVQLIEAHPPVVEIIPAHGRMIAEADLAQAERPARCAAYSAGSPVACRQSGVCM